MSPEIITVPTPIQNWSSEQIPQILAIENANWAPWLAASSESLAGRTRVCPQHQYMITNSGKIIGTLSTNRIAVSNMSQLPCWDDIAKGSNGTDGPTDFSAKHDPCGDTIVFMSMNVDSDHRGGGVAKQLGTHVINSAKADPTIQRVIGSFRPTGYGKYKYECHKARREPLSFQEYCILRYAEGERVGQLQDPWLNALEKNLGMMPHGVDDCAMTVKVSLETFHTYKQDYHPRSWFQIGENMWECGEVGTWTVNRIEDTATYTESNLWGIFYEKDARSTYHAQGVIFTA